MRRISHIPQTCKLVLLPCSPRFNDEGRQRLKVFLRPVVLKLHNPTAQEIVEVSKGKYESGIIQVECPA